EKTAAVRFFTATRWVRIPVLVDGPLSGPSFGLRCRAMSNSENNEPRSLLTYSGERVIGYVRSEGLRRSSTAYVTTERIIVNKSKGQLNLKAHLLTALLVAFAPFVAPAIAIAIILAIIGIVAIVSVKKRRSRKKWPSMKDVEEGVRLFEAKKGQVLTIELKQPGRLRRGYVRITPLSNEAFIVKIAGKKAFRVASNLMMGFEPSRVKVDR